MCQRNHFTSWTCTSTAQKWRGNCFLPSKCSANFGRFKRIFCCRYLALSVRLGTQLYLPRVLAIPELCVSEIVQHAREERWRQQAEAIFMGQLQRLGQGSGIRLLDIVLRLLLQSSGQLLPESG
jgi:hypothetical protein